MREVRRRSVRRKLKAELQEVTEDVNFSPTSSPATPLPLLPLATFASPPPVLWRDLQCPGSYKKLKSPLMFSPSSSSSSSSSSAENKENSRPGASVVRRRSHLFSPASLLSRGREACSGTTSSATLPSTPSTPALFGEGRHIPLMQGHLWKRSGSTKVWRKKYCTLLPGRLTYHPSLHAYLHDRGGKEVHMEAVTVKVGKEEEEGLHCLTIVSLNQQTWSFGCQGEVEREAWVHALHRGILSILQGGNIQDGTDTTLHQLRALPGNAACADCRSPNPEWVSVNLGLLLCIECCGAHRGLGSHVSKVRSLTLDQLAPATVDQVKRMGNACGARLWEARLVEEERIGAGASRLQRETFVLQKYVEGRWKKVEPPCDLSPI